MPDTIMAAEACEEGGSGCGATVNGLWYDDADDDWPLPLLPLLLLPLLLLLLPPSYGLIWNGLDSRYDGCTEADRF